MAPSTRTAAARSQHGKGGGRRRTLGVRRAFNVKAFHLVIRRYENCACNVNQIRAAYRCSNGNGSSESERRSWGGGRMSDERIGASSRQVAGPAIRALLYAVARPKNKKSRPSTMEGKDDTRDGGGKSKNRLLSCVSTRFFRR